MEDSEKVCQLLQSIDQNQKQLLKGQAESLQLQRKQVEMASVQFDRAERINERAEKIQETSAGIVTMARRAMVIILPVIVCLVVYLSWLIFR